MAEWKRRFWANTGSSYISMALRLGMGVFMFRLMFEGFDQDHLGFWYLLWSLFGYGLLLDFGFGFTAQKAVAEKSATGDTEGLNRLLATIFWTFVGIAITIFVVFSSISGSFVQHVLEKERALPAEVRREYIQAYLIFFGGIGIMFPLGLFPEILRGRQRIDLANWVNVATTVINFVGLYLGFKVFHWSFPIMMGISVVTSVLPNVVALFMAYKVLPGLSLKISQFDFKAVKSQMSFSLAAYIIAFSNLLMSKTDQLVLSMTIGASAIAIYQAGFKMGEMLETFAVQLQSALSPAAADLGARRDRAGLIELLQRSSRLTFLLITPLYALSAIYLDGLIRLLTGMKEISSETFWVGQALLLAIYSSQITNSCSKRILMMSGHERPLLWISVSDALLNLILSVILAKTMGILGVALGTLIATAAAGIFVVAPLTFSRLSLKFRDFMVFQAKGTIVPLGVFFAILAVLYFFLPLHPSDNSGILLWQLGWRGALAGLPVAILSWPVIRSMTH